MAFYGVPSAGEVLSASSTGDTIQLGIAQTAALSASVVGLEGNDVINFGAQGKIVTGSGSIGNFTLGFSTADIGASTGKTSTGSYIISAAVMASSRVSTGVTFSYNTKIHNSGIVVTGNTMAFQTVVTSEQAVRSFDGVTVDGGAGNDTIALGESVSGISATKFAGGAGADLIGNYTWINSTLATGSTAALNTAENMTIDGGAGNDTIAFYQAGTNQPETVFRSATIVGAQGTDSINMEVASGAFVNSQVLGGGGNDTIFLDFASGSAFTAAGGGGDDAISFIADSASNSFLGGDVEGLALSDWDGNDSISGSIKGGSGVTVFGGGGNDEIVFDIDAMKDLDIAGNQGNDTIRVSGTLGYLSAEIMAGGGDDLVLASGVQMSGASIFGGGGNDTIQYGTGANSTGDLTIFGGAGADVMAGTSSAAEAGVVFGYSAFSDSTLSSMDTIAHGLGTGTTVAFNYIPGGLTRASNFDESGAAFNYTATDGVVTFSGSTYSELTARVESLDSTLTTTGATVVFKDADSVAYVFTQGGSDDLLVKIEGTAVGDLGLTVSTVGSNSIITATRATT